MHSEGDKPVPDEVLDLVKEKPKKIETIGLSHAGPVTPAKTEEKPISKEEQRILYLETELSKAREDHCGCHDAKTELRNEVLALTADLHFARTEAADRRGAYKVQKAEAERLAGLLDRDPDQRELAALRAEVSTLHTVVNRKEGSVKDALIQADVHARRAKEQEAKVAALASTLLTMQIARDRAAERESAAYRKVAILELDHAGTVERYLKAVKENEEITQQINAVALAHSKGHPAAVAGCALCSALGREVSPAAAPAEVAKS